jgi:hypothetical protein
LVAAVAVPSEYQASQVAQVAVPLAGPSILAAPELPIKDF